MQAALAIETREAMAFTGLTTRQETEAATGTVQYTVSPFLAA